MSRDLAKECREAVAQDRRQRQVNIAVRRNLDHMRPRIRAYEDGYACVNWINAGFGKTMEEAFYEWKAGAARLLQYREW